MGKRSRRRGGDHDDGAAAGEPDAPQDAEATEREAHGRQPGADGEGEAPPDAPAGREPDGRLREVSLLVEEADYLLQLYRWIVLTGEVPRAQDWLRREAWPHPDYVIDVFGSWEKFLTHAGVTGSPLIAKLREAEAERKRTAAREKELARDEARVEDLRRQALTARHVREAAEAQRDEERLRADRLQRRIDAAELRATQAEERLHERREAAPVAAPDERIAALEDELEATGAHREELLRQVEELREAGERDARSLARLSALLAESGAAEEPGAPTADDAQGPATVLEATRRAAAASGHLIFTEAAFESAADSPYRRPAEIADTLAKLDELAGLFADPAGFGRSLVQAAGEAGLNYKHDVSEIARSQNKQAYTVTHDGHRLDLGPHVALGSGSGAGFIARIYLHVADGGGDVPRGVYVGHVGRHLPDTTT
jgi:hypothetical protein